MRSSRIVLATAVAAAVAVGCFLGGLRDLLADPDRYGWTWDVEVTADQGWGGLRHAETGEVFDALGIAEWAFVSFQYLPFAGGQVVPTVALTPGRGTLPGLGITAGRVPKQADEVALGAVTMRHLGVELGDRVALAGGGPSLLVVGRAVFSGIGKADTERPTLGEGAAVVSSLGTRFGIDERTPLDVSNAAVVRFGARAGAEELRSALPNHNIVEPAAPGFLEAWPHLRSVLRALWGLIGILALASLGHTLVLSARWRAGELGTLRALGMETGRLRIALACQAAVVVGTAAVVGAVLGGVLGRLAWNRFVDVVGVHSPLSPSWADVALPVALVVLALATSVAVAVRALPAGVQIPLPRDDQAGTRRWVIRHGAGATTPPW
jgi:hypothetical protein